MFPPGLVHICETHNLDNVLRCRCCCLLDNLYWRCLGHIFGCFGTIAQWWDWHKMYPWQKHLQLCILCFQKLLETFQQDRTKWSPKVGQKMAQWERRVLRAFLQQLYWLLQSVLLQFVFFWTRTEGHRLWLGWQHWGWYQGQARCSCCNSSQRRWRPLEAGRCRLPQHRLLLLVEWRTGTRTRRLQQPVKLKCNRHDYEKL